MNTRRALPYAFVLASILASLLIVIYGRVTYHDEVFFKAAGRHWAATGHFAAPEIAGYTDVQPGPDEVYLAQPPLYTFAFGLYCKLFGFGPLRCILFDELIHLCLIFLAMLLAHRVFEIHSPHIYIVAAIFLLVGTRGRPDELAMCLAILGFLSSTLDASKTIRASLSGIAFGLCAATSVGAALFLSPLLVFMAHQRYGLKLRNFLYLALTGAFTFALCLAPLLARHPLAYRQFLGLAIQQSVQVAEILKGVVRSNSSSIAELAGHTSPLKGMIASETEGLKMFFLFGKEIFAVIAGSILLILISVRDVPASSARTYRQLTLVIVTSMLIIWLVLPGKYTYLWFFSPWLISICAAVLLHSNDHPHRTKHVVRLALGGTCALLVIAMFMRDRLEMLSIPEGQGFYRNMSMVRRLVPAGSRVVTKEYWWALADKCDVLEPDYSQPTTTPVDYIIKTGNGSGIPGKPVVFEFTYDDYAAKNHFILVEDDLNRRPLKIGKLVLTHSAWGFGPYILARPSESRGSSNHAN